MKPAQTVIIRLITSFCLLCAGAVSAETSTANTLLLGTSSNLDNPTDISSPPAEALEETTPEASAQRVYLVTRLKLAGTDLTQVVFFQHPKMSTMEACEAERAAGLMNNWTYFGRYYLKTLKGVSYKVDYRCVETDLRLSYWRQGSSSNHSYLVRTGDNKLTLSQHPNFFECRDALRAVSKEESVDNFCAVSSQLILPSPGTSE